jgi:hypothetical protein
MDRVNPKLQAGFLIHYFIEKRDFLQVRSGMLSFLEKKSYFTS